MCGRYSNTRTRSDELQAKMAELLGVSQPESDHGFGRFNIAPTQEAFAAVADQGGRRIDTLRWGLIRIWFKMPSPLRDDQRPRRDDPRASRLQGLVEQSRHRCLVLADGWYEWQKPEDPKQPRRPGISLPPGGEPFFFAGLGRHAPQAPFSRSSPARRTKSHGRSMTACRACSRPAPGIHGSTRPSTARPSARLLGPLPPGQLSVRPANPFVNSALNEAPGCLAVTDTQSNIRPLAPGWRNDRRGLHSFKCG